MIAALMIGRAGSSGLPRKNMMEVLGRPLCAYPLLAAEHSRHVILTFVSTDCPEIAKVAFGFGAEIIERPPELATKAALGEDAFVHGYREIVRLAGEPELLVLLMANAATISGELIDEGIETLRAHPALDSAVTVSRFNMWSPARARRISDSGCLEPFMPQAAGAGNCDRDSQGDVWFADMGASIVRPRCLENIGSGMPPQRWMGTNIHPIKSEAGCDIDYAWQVPGVEWWLRRHGVDSQH